MIKNVVFLFQIENSVWQWNKQASVTNKLLYIMDLGLIYYLVHQNIKCQFTVVHYTV